MGGGYDLPLSPSSGPRLSHRAHNALRAQYSINHKAPSLKWASRADMREVFSSHVCSIRIDYIF